MAHRRTPQISDEGLYPRLLALRTNHTRYLPLFQLEYLYLKMVDIFKLSLRFYQKKNNEVQSLHSCRHASSDRLLRAVILKPLPGHTCPADHQSSLQQRAHDRTVSVCGTCVSSIKDGESSLLIR